MRQGKVSFYKFQELRIQFQQNEGLREQKKTRNILIHQMLSRKCPFVLKNGTFSPHPFSNLLLSKTLHKITMLTIDQILADGVCPQKSVQIFSKKAEL
jgi:hypothetical protein